MAHFRSWRFLVCQLAAVLVLVSCHAGTQTSSQPTAPPDTRAADEVAIRAADAAWSKAAGAKDAAATASFYADNAVLMAPGGPATVGKDAILKGFTGMMADKNFALSFAPTKIEVARSGDLAYDIGDFSLTVTDPKGKAQTLKAKYVVVWGKQADGSWKAVVDAPNTTTN
jgi:uncharacterized protein (TIGR02246 family)